MNFSPMNVPLIREEEKASRQRALQFRRRRRMSRPRSNQGPSQSIGISPPDKRILLPGGVMLRSSGISIFPQTKKSVQLLHSKPCCIVYCIFFAMPSNQEGKVAVGAKNFLRRHKTCSTVKWRKLAPSTRIHPSLARMVGE